MLSPQGYVVNLFRQSEKYPELPLLFHKKLLAKSIKISWVRLCNVFVQKRVLFRLLYTKINSLLKIKENPMTSKRQVALKWQCMSYNDWRYLKLANYKIHLTQELYDDDSDRKIGFCEEIMRKLNKHELLLTHEILQNFKDTYMEFLQSLFAV